jgi:hypothetical protein
MKTIFNKVQTTFKALQLLSEPEIMNKLYSEVGIQKKNKKSLEASSGKFIFHKHFIVQVMN